MARPLARCCRVGPGSGHDAEELISACLTASSPTDLLGRVGSRLADPEAAPWPPFAIAASRGPELVAVVHGPVELIEDQDGEERRLYGGRRRWLLAEPALEEAHDRCAPAGLATTRDWPTSGRASSGRVASCCCHRAGRPRRERLACGRMRRLLYSPFRPAPAKAWPLKAKARPLRDNPP